MLKRFYKVIMMESFAVFHDTNTRVLLRIRSFLIVIGSDTTPQWSPQFPKSDGFAVYFCVFKSEVDPDLLNPLMLSNCAL